MKGNHAVHVGNGLIVSKKTLKGSTHWMRAAAQRRIVVLMCVKCTVTPTGCGVLPCGASISPGGRTFSQLLEIEQRCISVAGNARSEAAGVG